MAYVHEADTQKHSLCTWGKPSNIFRNSSKCTHTEPSNLHISLPFFFVIIFWGEFRLIIIKRYTIFTHYTIKNKLLRFYTLTAKGEEKEKKVLCVCKSNQSNYQKSPHLRQTAVTHSKCVLAHTYWGPSLVDITHYPFLIRQPTGSLFSSSGVNRDIEGKLQRVFEEAFEEQF